MHKSIYVAWAAGVLLSMILGTQLAVGADESLSLVDQTLVTAEQVAPVERMFADSTVVDRVANSTPVERELSVLDRASVRPVAKSSKTNQAEPSASDEMSSFIPSFSSFLKPSSDEFRRVGHLGRLGICGPGCGAQSFAYGRICGCEPCRPFIWGRAEFLSYWLTGYDTPPLLTQSPAGTPQDQVGVLDQAGTNVLFGDDRLGTGRD